jgi:acyl-CoA thioesterase I
LAASSKSGSRCVVATAVAVSLAFSFALAPPAFAGGCTAPVELIKLQAPLPKLAASIKTNTPLTIVALGSSSTSGAGASSRAFSYPSRLEKELRAVWPNNDVHVVNAGVGGQLAVHMVARIDKDVLSRNPQLVIWQTGVNDAIKGVPLDKFTSQLRLGMDRFRKAGVDVVLIDQQYYPRFKKLKDGPLYLAAIRDVAAQYGVPMVQRFRIMQHLIDTAQFTTATLLSPDQFHLNDSSYGCLGHLLAESLRSAASASAAALAGVAPPDAKKKSAASPVTPAAAAVPVAVPAAVKASSIETPKGDAAPGAKLTVSKEANM